MSRTFAYITTFIALAVFSQKGFALGASAPSSQACDSGLSASRLSQLVSQYVPRGSNGKGSAAAFYEVDSQGNVKKSLYTKNPHVSQAVASTQKIVTAYTAYKMGGLNNRVTWNSSDQAYDVQGGRAIIRSTGRNPAQGQGIVAHDLLKTLMEQSSNGAALALSRSSSHQSSRVFVDMMNEYSRKLISASTTYKTFFQNPAGLTDTSSSYRLASSSNTQLSTADNMARLTGKIMRDTGFTSEMSRRGMSYFNGGQVSKVGFTQAAGRTIVAYIPFPKCKSQGLSLALFGENSSTQFSRMAELLNQLRKELGY